MISPELLKYMTVEISPPTVLITSYIENPQERNARLQRRLFQIEVTFDDYKYIWRKGLQSYSEAQDAKVFLEHGMKQAVRSALDRYLRETSVKDEWWRVTK